MGVHFPINWEFAQIKIHNSRDENDFRLVQGKVLLNIDYFNWVEIYPDSWAIEIHLRDDQYFSIEYNEPQAFKNALALLSSVEAPHA